MGNINKLDFNATYKEHVRNLQKQHGVRLFSSKSKRKTPMELAVGGDFEAVGHKEVALLRQAGLRDGQYLVDVGCGSGRLAEPLSKAMRNMKYLGIDIIPELLEHARSLVSDPAYRFERAEGLNIQERDGVADMACFFSLMTHLLHEQSYIYLKEALRVLKPGGKAVFSFLEFRVEDHWNVFKVNMEDIGPDGMPGALHLNMFMSRDMIEAWQQRLPMRIDELHSGDEAFIVFDKPITLSDGRVLEGPQHFGQSVCIATKTG